MSLSLNETHKLVKDAARGSGLSWGEADELARAAVWLEVAGQHGLINACRAVDEHLNALASTVEFSSADGTIILSPCYGTGDGRIGALAAGLAARDLLSPARGENVITIKSVFLPILAVGLIAPVDPAPNNQHTITVSTTDGNTATFVRTHHDVRVHNTPQHKKSPHALVDMTITSTVLDISKPRTAGEIIWSETIHQTALENGLSPDITAVNPLRALAHNCLVPATEESRLKGAGAGTVDRD